MTNLIFNNQEIMRERHAYYYIKLFLNCDYCMRLVKVIFCELSASKSSRSSNNFLSEVGIGHLAQGLPCLHEAPGYNFRTAETESGSPNLSSQYLGGRCKRIRRSTVISGYIWYLRPYGIMKPCGLHETLLPSQN